MTYDAFLLSPNHGRMVSRRPASMPHGAEYTGHGPSGSLQVHSKGELYPFIIYRIERDGELFGKPARLPYFRIMHAAWGDMGCQFVHYDEAKVALRRALAVADLATAALPYPTPAYRRAVHVWLEAQRTYHAGESTYHEH